MSDFTLCFVGDHLCANSSVCFQEKDRREIAENKWRDFFRDAPAVRAARSDPWVRLQQTVLPVSL